MKLVKERPVNEFKCGERGPQCKASVSVKEISAIKKKLAFCIEKARKTSQREPPP